MPRASTSETIHAAAVGVSMKIHAAGMDLMEFHVAGMDSGGNPMPRAPISNKIHAAGVDSNKTLSRWHGF